MKFTKTETLIAGLLFLVSIPTVPIFYDAWKESRPLSEWFEVRRLSPGDAFEGEMIPLVYDRDIKRPFEGFYLVKVQNVEHGDSEFPSCSSSGRVHYTPKEGTVTISLADFMQKDCKLKAGVYVVEAAWTIRRPGYEDRVFPFTSSPFTVREKK